MKFNLLIFGLFALAIPAATVAKSPRNGSSNALKNTIILIIRHAEKPNSGHGLSSKGKARAQAYADYFKSLTIDGWPLKPDYMFATADSKESYRARLTIEPAAEALGLAIDSRFRNKDVQELAEEIQSKPHGRVMLISWHHDAIPELLEALGIDPGAVLPKGKWPTDVFDWLIQLRYDQRGKLAEAKRIKENLPPGKKAIRKTR